MSDALEVTRAAGRWRIVDAAAKLDARGALPGAYTFDRTAHAFRQAIALGVPASLLLPPAMPSSWMVNNRAPSPALRAWISKDAAPCWQALIDALSDGPEGWLAAGDAARDEVAEAVGALARVGHGACAISKVLALLCPDTVPLMDDAAVFLLTGRGAMPENADAPSAEADAFVPMLDAFNRAVLEVEPALLALADAYRLSPSSPSQILDRLLWFDSYGHRVVRAGYRVEDADGVYAVVRESQPRAQ